MKHYTYTYSDDPREEALSVRDCDCPKMWFGVVPAPSCPVHAELSATYTHLMLVDILRQAGRMPHS